MEPEDIKVLIETGLPGSMVFVQGDGTHFEAVIVYDQFKGMGLIEQHKTVYKTLGDAMRERVHALSLKTYTPEQWEKSRK
jgi:acid stress-induced BolA-like protein IbaG/YrbA